MRRHCRHFAVLPGLAAVVAFAAEPVASSLDSLVKNSPFGSAASAALPGAGESGILEFRGMIVDNGEPLFSFFDPATRSSQWVKLNESGAPYTVQSYDRENQTVKVLFRNQPLVLAMKRSQIIVQAGQPVAPMAAGPQNVPVAVASAPSPNEAARLAQVAEEIRRRRALRTQGTPPMPQPVPINAPPSAPQPRP